MSRTRKGIMIVATDGEDSCDGDPCAAAQCRDRDEPEPHN